MTVPAAEAAAKMYFRTLGNTGIITSVFGFGFWATFGVKSGLLDREGVDAAKKIMTVAREGGINLFDNVSRCSARRCLYLPVCINKYIVSPCLS
jgi:alkyl sulfatase BDS1-like metallo-beta-lactamase superfamily hydrolase